MQTPVSLVVLGASLLAALSLTAQQPDRAAQARALEALRQKMAEMENAPAPAQTTPPPVTRTAPAAPVATPPPVATQPQATKSYSSPPAGSELDARLREALDREMHQGGSTAPMTVQPQPGSSMTAMPEFSEPPPPSNPNVRLDILPAPTAVVTEPAVEPPAVVTSPVTPAPAITPRPSTPSEMGPIVIADGVSEALNPPPSAISTIKEQKLANLLQQYLANAISPEQYHKQRAEILAGN